MTEYISWETLGTYAGALAMVLILTQFTKDLSFTKKVPTQIWSYILALAVMFPAAIFTGTFSAQAVLEVVFNAVIVSLAANGGYSAFKKGLGTDGHLLIDTSNPNKDIYRLDLDTELDNLAKKNTVTLTIKPGSDLSEIQR